MLPCIQLFRNELLRCMHDCIDILNDDFKNDEDAMILVDELIEAIDKVKSFPELLVRKLIEGFYKIILPIKGHVEERNRTFFEDIIACQHCLDETRDDLKCVCKSRCREECDCSDQCINCSMILTKMDSKTFKAIKKIMKNGHDDDVETMFQYIEVFMQLGKQYSKSTKVKLS